MNFPVLATDEETEKEMLSALPNMMVVRPKFSVRNAVSDHRLPFGGGLMLLALGLAGLVGTLWQVPKTHRSAATLPN